MADVLDGLGTGPALMLSMRDNEVGALLVELSRLASRTRVRLAEVVTEGRRRGLPCDAGASGQKAWLAHALLLSRRDAAHLLATAHALDVAAGDPVTAVLADDARTGTIGVDQAVVAAEVVTGLPPEVADLRGAAAAAMRGHAAEFDPVRLARIGRHLICVLDPERGDALLADQLERDERAAVDRRYLDVHAAVNGLVHGRFALTVSDAAVLTAALSPLAAPLPAVPDGAVRDTADRHAEDHDDGSEGHRSPEDAMASGSRDALRDPRTPRQRMADALVEVCRRSLGAAKVPVSGGERAQVVVTLSLDRLREQTGGGDLLDGTPVAPSVVRRMACDARIVPVVLGGAGQPLDVGRETRTVPTGLRRALVLRDRHCAFPGCDRPAGWCEAHHVQHWSKDGVTALDNLVLLCGHHHRTVHDRGWSIRFGPDGRPRFGPPP